MQQYPRAHVLSSLAVVLNVTAPATIILTAPGPGTDAAFGIRGSGTPDHVPALTVSYGDAA